MTTPSGDHAAPLETPSGPETHSSDAGWFGHPPQLARLFTTEAMERFGFYGMRALLALYLVLHFQYSGASAGALVGGYLALVYLTPFIGGMLADRVLGYKKAVKFGALVMSAGYLLLCFGGDAAKPFAHIDGQRYDIEVVHHGKEVSQFVTDRGQKLKIKGQDDGSVSLLDAQGHAVRHIAAANFLPDATRDPFYATLALISLAIISIGNGFFKPNISTIVGSLYGVNDPRRDAGYAIFYMSINLGSLFSQLICPVLAVGMGSWAGIGWGAGFGLAAAGMLIAFALIQFSGKQLSGFGETPEGVAPHKTWATYIGTLAAIPVVWWLLTDVLAGGDGGSSQGIWAYLVALPTLGKLLGLSFVITIPAVLIWAWAKGTRVEAEMMTAALVLIAFNTVFMSLFEQAATSLTLFAQQNTNMSVFGLFEITAGQTQFFNAFFIVMLTPVFNWVWRRLRISGYEPSIPSKFALALIGAGAGFLFLVWGSHFADATWKVGLWWLVGLYLIHSIAELCIQPVGLSMISKLAMKRVVGLMFGLWFLSIAVAEYVAGALSALASTKTVAGEVADLHLSLTSYVASFWNVGWFAVVAGVVLLALSVPMKRLMHGVD